ncbi:FhaA domain-containing protein [Aeromicrobium wangtongii]|uniref:FHA domain-containing protein n=1 Tax=Aeromicrobium wangtongii TaxID=2969247 RepID=A0ABY5M6B8_9ACTN|nr:FHA domain-containing protein [Aeromicrobium wangtongii]MCD9198295.1 FHA domain-containing protein [Aeromicrobium wangtongii]UUP12327.1 FHA domain-containing protein [Aeromicrobium wangtongii]
MGLLSTLTSNLLILVVFVVVILGGLRIAQSIFGTSTKKAAATEIAAKLVSYPTGSAAVLRRRFARALTGQHVIMPSGERLAFGELAVRIAPEDLERLDPDGDLERLGEDGAVLYRDHAERVGWALPAEVRVTVQVDPGLRSGWIPPARGTGRAEPVRREPTAQPIGWDAVSESPSRAARPRPVPSAPRAAIDPDATMNFPALVPDLHDPAPTMNVAGVLRLARGGRASVVGADGAVLGRLPASPVTFPEPEVSYRHAAIRQQGPTWQIKDLGSTNGTTVDGEPISGDWVTLRGGAVIKLAGVTVTVALDTTGTVHLQGVTGQ